LAYLNHNLPPFSAYIRNEYLYDHEKGHGDFTFADVHTVNSLERRALLFECLLPNGVNWTRRPIHAFCWKKDAPKHNLNIHQYWDCFSPYVDVQRRNRLANCRAELVDYKGVKRKGTYMFTYPNNRTIWYDDAYMDKRLTENPGYKIDQNFYTVENTREEDTTTDDSYMTQFERP